MLLFWKDFGIVYFPGARRSLRKIFLLCNCLERSGPFWSSDISCWQFFFCYVGCYEPVFRLFPFILVRTAKNDEPNRFITPQTKNEIFQTHKLYKVPVAPNIIWRDVNYPKPLFHVWTEQLKSVAHLLAETAF